jgi:glycosyltransferase involved in cell wall biosynthesis
MAHELKKRNIQVVLCNTFPAASRVGTACRFAGIPYGIYVREYISDQAIHRNILRKANLVFAESRDVQSYLNSMVNPAKIKVAYDYIDAHPILERVLAHRLRDGRLVPFETEHPVVGIVGRISKYKQQDLFIRAIPYVLKELPETRFVVVGGSQITEKDYEDQLKQLASKLGVQDKVVFMGPRKDAIEIISELSVSCLTSSREPLGRVILEAHLIHCPVIAPDTGGPPEIVEDEVTGLLFSSTEPNSAQELATRILRLLMDSNLRGRLTAKASERIHTTFAGVKHVREFENLLDQLSCMDGKVDIG